MGMTRVNVTVRNIVEPDRSWTGLFLVDTGATDSMVPKTVLEAIGLSPIRQRTYRMGDGRRITFDITKADLEFMSESTASDVIMGGPDTEPILGVTALESTGMEVDPRSGTLRQLPEVSLVGYTVSPGPPDQEPGDGAGSQSSEGG